MKYFRLIITFFRFVVLKSCNRFPRIMSIEDTIEFVTSNHVSVSRFGDGEFNLICGNSIGFQEYSDDLKLDLLNSLNSEKCFVALPGVLSTMSGYRLKSRLIWMNLILKDYNQYKNYIDFNKCYLNSLFTRPYMDFYNKKVSKDFFFKLKKIWESREVLLIEGIDTKFGVGNSLLDNTSSIRRILCPNVNSYGSIDHIIGAVYKNASESTLILVALGPTATVLAHKLSNVFQVIDIGHLDIEYEWYLSNQKNKVCVKGKYVNETTDKLINDLDCDLSIYESQILCNLIS